MRRTPWTPPANTTAERALVSMALTLGPDADPAIWILTAADFYDYRHAALWKVAQEACKRGERGYQSPAMFDAATGPYLALVATTAWPSAAALVERVRDASATRRMLDACWHLCAAWADADRARWQGEIAKIAAAATGKDAPPDRQRAANAYAHRASRYEVHP